MQKNNYISLFVACCLAFVFTNSYSQNRFGAGIAYTNKRSPRWSDVDVINYKPSYNSGITGYIECRLTKHFRIDIEGFYTNFFLKYDVIGPEPLYSTKTKVKYSEISVTAKWVFRTDKKLKIYFGIGGFFYNAHKITLSESNPNSYYAQPMKDVNFGGINQKIGVKYPIYKNVNIYLGLMNRMEVSLPGSFHNFHGAFVPSLIIGVCYN